MKQENIPIGCIPPSLVTTTRCHYSCGWGTGVGHQVNKFEQVSNDDQPLVDLEGGTRDMYPQASKFFQFYAVFGKIWQNCVLVPPIGRVSAPTSEKSWTRHCHQMSVARGRVLVNKFLVWCPGGIGYHGVPLPCGLSYDACDVPTPLGQNDWQTPVKTLPPATLFAGSNYVCLFKLMWKFCQLSLSIRTYLSVHLHWHGSLLSNPEQLFTFNFILLRNGPRNHSCFSDFVSKIRLIRLPFSFQKQKILYLNSQPTIPSQDS